MKKKIKHILLFLILFISISVLFCGCNVIPTTPGVDPNPDINPDNSQVSYIEVSSSASTMQTGETMQFVVKGYNSEDEQVILDESKLFLWRWTVIEQCASCIAGLVSLSPTRNSLTTIFSSDASGKFYIAAYYSIGEDFRSHYKEIQITSKVKTIYDINSKQ